jgi:hypothetical protein
MGTTLTGTTPQDTYDSLIKVTDNGPLSGTLKALSDGLGNDSTLSLSTTAASIAGTLAVSGAATFDTTTLVVDATNNRVGIGTATPSTTLEVTDSLRVSVAGPSRYFDVTEGTIKLYSSAVEPSIKFGDYNTGLDRLATIGFEGNYFGRGALSFVVKEQGSGTAAEAMRLTSAGVLSLNQGQIQFPATQVASADVNTLDDYEEGTWTMGVAFDGASAGVTYSQNTGTYTKIGRQVTVNGRMDLTSKGSSTGDAAITGLPFTVPNNVANNSAASLVLISVSFANQFEGFAVENSTIISLFETTILGALTTLTNADFANNSAIVVSLTYFV